MPRKTVVRNPSQRLGRSSAMSLSPAAVVVLVSLGVRCFQLFALKVASAAQVPTGPPNMDGTPFSQYFVFKPSTASPGLGPVLGNWDGQWYMRIAQVGYPPADQVQSANDAWVSAFPPGFPLLARVTMSVTGLPFVWAAFIINTALTLVAAVLLFQLLRSSGLVTRVAVAGGIGISILPASPVLVAAYSEALALTLVVLGLRLLLSHRYLLLSIAVVALAVTRPVAIAFAPVVVVHAAMRWRVDRQSVRRWEWCGMGVAVLVATISPWVWPRTAALLYGVPDGMQYVGSARTTQTVAGLESGYLGNAWAGSGVSGLIFVLASAMLLICVPVFLGLRIGWPVELLAWGAAYLAMIVIVTPPSPALLRYLVLAAPLLTVVFAAPLARPSAVKNVLLFVIVGACLWSQLLWIRYVFIYDAGSQFAP